MAGVPTVATRPPKWYQLGVPVLRSALLCLTLGSCFEPPVDLTVASFELRLATDGECRPAVAVDRVEARALGDFGTIVEVLPGTTGSGSIDRFPLDTQAISFTAFTSEPWRGAGAAWLGETGTIPVLTLPFGPSCVIADSETRLAEGAAVVALPYDGLLIAGGTQDGSGVRRVVRWRVGDRISTLVTDGLRNRRTGATATLTGSLVVLAGGGTDRTGPALDNYEVYDVRTGEMDRRLGGALCATDPCSGRRDHGAVALPDGRVLVVGGATESDASPLVTAALIDPRAGTVEEDIGDLPSARLRPHVLRLDDGSVLVVGGFGAGDGMGCMGTGCPTGTVYAFDVELRAFARIDPDVIHSFTVHSNAVAVAMVGARVAWIADESEVIELLILRDGPFNHERVDIDLRGRLPRLTGVRAAALPNGELLVSGSDETLRSRAFVVDVGRERVQQVSSSRLATALVPLGDGMVAELDEAGTSLRRALLRTEVDNPPVTLAADDAAFLALDASPNWLPGTLEARVNDASLSIAGVTFTNVSVTALLSVGEGTLAFISDQGFRVSVVMRTAVAGPPLCEVERAPGAPVRVERAGNVLTVSAGRETRRCVVEGLSTRIRLEARLRAGARLAGVQILRQ